MGVAIGDYDNDGNADLFVTNYGRNILYHNNGDGTFTDVTAKAGVAGGGWSISAGFVDFDNDGLLDLFVTRYMEWDMRHSKMCVGAWQTYCPPAEFPATANLLYRNRGDGTFEDISMKSGIAAKKGRALGVSFADYDDDGFTDIFVSNDGMQQYLFRNNGNGTFAECALERGASDGSLSGGHRFKIRQRWATDIPVTVSLAICGLYHHEGDGLILNQLETGLGALTAASAGWRTV
jgi:hypothetical protein